MDPFAQYEKTRLVTKLRGAREHIRDTMGKCEGRKSYAELDGDDLRRDPLAVRKATPASLLRRGGAGVSLQRAALCLMWR